MMNLRKSIDLKKHIYLELTKYLLKFVKVI
jgi:hypothetical protein